MHEAAARFLAVTSKISPEDLAAVRRHIDALLSLTPTVPPRPSASKRELPPASDELSRFLEVFMRTTQSLGLSCPPVPVLRRQRFFAAHEYKIHDVMTWADRLRDRNLRVGLYGLGLRALHAYLLEGVPVRWDTKNKFLVRAKNIAVGPRELLIFMDYLPLVMENAYPGYAGAGLLGMIVSVNNQRRKGNLHAGQKSSSKPSRRRRSNA